MGNSPEVPEQRPRTEHILIDFENIQPANLGLLERDNHQLKVFLGPGQSQVAKEFVLTIQKLRGEFHDVVQPGKNAVDFHIAYYLGRLTAEDPQARFYVISKDTGYDPLIHHLKESGLYAWRLECIEEIHSVRDADRRRKKELVEAAIAFLQGLEEKRPNTLEALRNSLGSKFDLEKERLDALIQTLQCKRCVSEKSGKLEYGLPKAAARVLAE